MGMKRWRTPTAASTTSGVKIPRTPESGLIVTPLMAAGAPPSLATMCELPSISTVSPGWVWIRSAIWFDMVPVGT